MTPASHNSQPSIRLVIANILGPSAILLVYYLFVLSGNADNVRKLPTVMALLNGLSSALLLGAYVNIRRKKAEVHRNLNLMALSASAMFLTSYAVYHYFQAGPVHYTGDYPVIYYVILFTHIPLAAVIVPLALITVIYGLHGKKVKHRKIARITFPLWLYVSVTGVIIYFMLN
ncbi:MAG: DUF420 domain-containing protein [Fidelibacterota bacterium]